MKKYLFEYINKKKYIFVCTLIHKTDKTDYTQIYLKKFGAIKIQNIVDE